MIADLVARFIYRIVSFTSCLIETSITSDHIRGKPFNKIHLPKLYYMVKILDLPRRSHNIAHCYDLLL
jgi:hypothetical protein